METGKSPQTPQGRKLIQGLTKISIKNNPRNLNDHVFQGDYLLHLLTINQHPSSQEQNLRRMKKQKLIQSRRSRVQKVLQKKLN